MALTPTPIDVTADPGTSAAGNDFVFILGVATSGDVFTLTSIAAVVIGGVSLFGGRGSGIGAIAGAFVLTILVSVLFFANIDPLYEPFYEGVFLVLAASLTAVLGMLVRRRLTAGRRDR